MFRPVLLSLMTVIILGKERVSYEISRLAIFPIFLLLSIFFLNFVVFIFTSNPFSLNTEKLTHNRVPYFINALFMNGLYAVVLHIHSVFSKR